MAPGTVRIAGTQFLPENSTTTFNAVAQSGIYSPTGGGAFRTQVPLPAGAIVTGVRIRVLDSEADPAFKASALVRRVDMFNQVTAVDGPEASTVGAPGFATLTPVIPAAVAPTDLFLLRVTLTAGNQTALYGAEVDYR